MADRFQLRVARSGAILGTEVERADSHWQRMVGLLGRRSLSPGGGMRFEAASSLHMMFMRFAIDVVYFDREQRVVKLVSDFKPWRFSAARGARGAYELAAGVIAASDVIVGDELILEAGVARDATVA